MILDILSQSKCHPTAEEILTEVRKLDDKVARGTVYRNLAQLVEGGDVIKITTQEGVCRYDYIHKDHSHAVCSRCGGVTDFCVSELGAMAEMLKERYGFTAFSSGLAVCGLCRECKKTVDNAR